MAESYPNGKKTMSEKEKLLVTSNFSFSDSVFKKLVSQWRQKVSLCGNGFTPFSTVFQLYCGSKYTYPCFPGVRLTSTPHNILSNPLATFPHNYCRNNGQQWERNEPCPNDYHESLERILAKPGTEPGTSCSQVLYATSYARLGQKYGKSELKRLQIKWIMRLKKDKKFLMTRKTLWEKKRHSYPTDIGSPHIPPRYWY